MTTERTEERKNRFNGESVMLTKAKRLKFMTRYSYMNYRQRLRTENWAQDLASIGKMRDKLAWFMKNNAKAYMVLLD